MSRGKAPSGQRLPPLSDESRHRRALAGYFGPRGVRTGRFAQSFRIAPDGDGYRVAPVEERPGQFLAILGGVSPRVRLGKERVQEAMRKAIVHPTSPVVSADGFEPLDFGEALMPGPVAPAASSGDLEPLDFGDALL